MKLAKHSFAPLALVFGLALTGRASAQTPAPAPTPSPAGPKLAIAGSEAPQAGPTPQVRTTAAPSPTAARAVHVLSLDSDSADDQVEALTSALRARVRALSGWQLGATTTSLSMVTAALRCPQRPDADCTQRMGDELKSDRVMYGWITKSGARDVTAEVHLWTRGQREITAVETYPDTLVNPSDPKLQAVADRLLEKLTGEKPAAAKPPARSEEKKEKEPTEPAESGGVSARTVVAWSAIGLGVAAGVFGTVQGVRFLSLQSDNKDDAKQAGGDFCGPGGNASACDRYEDGKTARTLEFISFGVGAALIGTGVVLLVTDHKKEPAPRAAARKWQVAPHVGPRGGSVDLKLTF